jgi:hypothetical protein
MLFDCYEELRRQPQAAERVIAAIAHQRIERAITDQSPSMGPHKANRDFE